MPRISKPSQVERDLLEGLGEVLADVRGEMELPRRRIEISPVTAARQILGMSQAEFSSFLDVPVSTLKKWEQGQRTLTGAARALVTIIEREPDAVRRAFSREGAPA